MSGADVLVWDCSSCPSKTIGFLSELQAIRRAAFTSIFVAAGQSNQIPLSLGGAAVAFPITTRLGPYAIHDVVVDVLGCLAQSRGHCSITLISANFALWFAIFQRLPPKALLIVSSADPRMSLEFTFLPQTMPIRTLTWPNLEDSASAGASRPPDSEFLHHMPDEMSGDVPWEPNEGSDDRLNLTSHDVIQPLDDLEGHEFDIRSPVTSREVAKPPAQKASLQHVQVPLKFKPLIEVMKSFGKAMVSLSDLERELKNWFTQHGQLSEDTTTYLTKAADAQVVVIDKTVNFVRLRNRNLAKRPIEYV